MNQPNRRKKRQDWITEECRSVNILLVEDDYLLGRSTARLLEKLGEHRVRLTHKAADVFKRCESGWSDLVIMDVNLPGTFWQGAEISGADLSRLLKSQSQTAHIPVVLLTAYVAESEQTPLLENSLANHLCTKPIVDYEAFLALLEQICRGESPQSMTASAS